MQVVRVGAGEWAALRELRLRALAEAPHAFSSTHAREAAWSDDEWRDWAVASERGDRQATFAAVVPSGWIGMAFGVLSEAEIADLYGMWVDPTARRTGAGSALARAVVEWAEAAGRPFVRLNVAQANKSAISLYRNLGFRPTGRVGVMHSNPSSAQIEYLRAPDTTCDRPIGPAGVGDALGDSNPDE